MAKKKIVVISGGNKGIGLAIAKALSEFQVVILARDPELTKQVAEEQGFEYEICDVTDYAAVEQAVKNIVKRHDAIDVLVNNAGVFTEGELQDADPSLIDKLVDVNTKGPMYVTRAALPTLLKQGKGLIVNIVSQGGIYTKPGRAIYYASKWAITGFTKSLREDLSSKGIRVTGIYPGKVATDLFKTAGIEKDLSGGLEANDVARAVAFVVREDEHVNIPMLEIEYLK